MASLVGAPSSVSSTRAESKAREAEEKKQHERQKALLVLILRHLADSGYVDSVAKLQQECGLSLERLDAADNVDLLGLLSAFEEQMLNRIGKSPKLIKCVASADEAEKQHAASKSNVLRRQRSAGTSTASDAASSASQRNSSYNAGSKHSSKRASRQDDGQSSDQQHAQLGIEGIPVNNQQIGRKTNESEQALAAQDDTPMLKPLPEFASAEMRELAQAVSKDIYYGSPGIQWNFIAGLDEAKRLLRESVVQPAKYPQFFSGLLAPWRGLLLYGPPGTGKTLLAKAVATESQTTLFAITASSVVSKWRGDSEKIVRALFELARHHAPATIFMDEIDALVGQRDGGSGEHEASRRMKTELMVQLDGLASSDAPVFLLGATNVPWELDHALLRRLEKRVHVPLPGKDARREMIHSLLADRKPAAAIDFDNIAERTEGFSGADLRVLCKESAMRPVRRLLARLEAPESEVDTREPATVGEIELEDMEDALRKTKPSATEKYSEAYRHFTANFGQSAM